MRFPRLARSAFAFAALFPHGATALDIRGFVPAQHHRLVDFPGAPVYQQIPSPNPDFTHAPAALFRGIGWPAHPTDWTRQMALVSPRHFVCATHYPPGGDWQIAFAGGDGQQHLYGIESQTPIVNTLGETTDLMLCTLSSEVDPATGILPFAVLNLASESAYQNQEMIVFGGFVRAGRMPLHGFTTLVNDPGFDTTRFAYFDYNHDGGGIHDCDYQGGDSGAPTFIMDCGVPALIGIASGRDPQGWGGLPANISRNYIAFIPGYLDQVDALMEEKGLHLKRSRPAATCVGLQVSASALRRLMPGGASFQLYNTGGETAHNLELSLDFQHAPASVQGGGMTSDAIASGKWRCRKGGLPAAGSAEVTAAWSIIPDVSEILVTADHSFDGMNARSSVISIPVIESYASWIQGAADPAQAADPDHDGLSNLLEYALGGSPGDPSAVSPQGHPLGPSASLADGILEFSFARRTDAAARGLSYAVEHTTDPSTGGWSAESLPGTTVSVAPFVPASEGFERVTLGTQVGNQRLFLRLRITLAE